MEKRSGSDWADEILAGEYALSLLDDARAAQAQERVRDDAEFRAKVGRWEHHFASLVPVLESLPPPPTVWQNIERELALTPPPLQTVIRPAPDGRPFWLRTAFWRSVAAASVFAALLLSIGSTFFDSSNLRSRSGDQTAWTLIDNDKRPQFVAQWDGNRRAMMVSPLGAGKGFAGTLHVWAISRDAQPRYLGALNTDGVTTLVIDDPELSAVLQRRELAISMETSASSGAARTSDPIILRGIPTQPPR